ncbi:MAG: hypothetical protein LBM96_01065 [Methanobrevibacter sp.]|nr:hypothetical protein [Candidatus Methanoflexus mossambicus]
MTLVKNDIKPYLLKNISKIAKKEGISEEKLINEAIEKGLNIIEKYDCEAFGKEIDEARADSGEKVDIDDLAEEFGVDLN